MNTIRGIEKLEQILSPKDIKQLEGAAKIHKKYSNIEFEVEDASAEEISIFAEQGQNPSGNYANQKTLIKRVHEVFDKAIPAGITLNIRTQEFFESPAVKVTTDWIEKQMLEKEIRIKQIAFDTGINKSDISAWLSGIKPMSQIVKALFYYYFVSK